jgi:thymidylate kinase
VPVDTFFLVYRLFYKPLLTTKWIGQQIGSEIRSPVKFSDTILYASSINNDASTETLRPLDRRQDILQKCFRALSDANIEFCVSNSYETLPDQIESDIDCTVSKDVSVTDIVKAFDRKGIAVVQIFKRESSAAVFVVSDMRPSKPEFIWIDISSDFRQNGGVFFSGSALLADKVPYKDFWIPSPAAEFGHYLAKKIVQGSLPRQGAKRLTELYLSDIQGCAKYINEFWHGRNAELIISAASTGDWTHIYHRLPQLRRGLFRARGIYNPINVIRYWSPELARRIRRLIRPTGLHVVLLGPDGAGKSTILEALDRDLAPAFRRTLRFHLQPGLLRRSSGNGSPVVNPHGKKPRSKVESLAKAWIWFFEYTIGYFVKVRPRLSQSSLVLFDRYLADVIVDPLRYRYGGSPRLVQAIWKVVPKPDLIVLLDVPPEILQRRKQEVLFGESERSRNEYLTLVRNISYANVIDASQPLNVVSASVNTIIMNHLINRSRLRLNIAEAGPLIEQETSFVFDSTDYGSNQK